MFPTYNLCFQLNNRVSKSLISKSEVMKDFDSSSRNFIGWPIMDQHYLGGVSLSDFSFQNPD